VLIIKSTVPPGTTKNEVIPYLAKKGFIEGDGFAVANNPEFLREGKCWDDFIVPDRIVCGVQNKQAEDVLRRLYTPFNAVLHIVSLNTGEYIKYLSNTMLATMISYANEMSMIADGIGDIDIRRAFHILHEDKRLKGSGIASYLFPGCGYGGYCLPKDIQALATQAIAYNIAPRLLQDVIEINNNMSIYFVNKILNIATSEKKIGVLGLSFKPNSDDVRDSPAAKIIALLQEAKYNNIYVYDPVANDIFKKTHRFNNLVYCKSKEEICQKSDVVVLITAWDEFKNIHVAFPQNIIIDCRYFLEDIK
jgi:UDPglucose 6-dehydrogenase